MDLPTLTISAANGWLDQRDRFSSNIAGSEQKNYTLLHKGELSYNHGNSKLAKYGTVFALRTYEEALVPRVYHSFKVVEEANSDFIEYVFATKLPDRELGKLISSGARMDGLLNINYDEFMSINMMLPSVEEQIRISDHLRKIDTIITLHQRQKTISIENNQYVWEQRKLESVAEFNPKSELPEEFEYVDLESVVGTEMISHRKETKESAPSRAQRLAKTGDVFFQTVRPYQKNNYLFEKPDNNYVFSTGYAQMRPNIESTFLMSFLQTDGFVKVVLDNCTGTSYPAINSSDLANLVITYPASREEQKLIGQYITKIDYLITLHQCKCQIIRFKCLNDWEQRKLEDVLERRIEQRQQSEEYPRLAFASGQGVIPLSERKTNNREQLTKDEFTKKYLVTELDDIVYNPANVKYGAIDRNKCGRGLISPIYVTFTTSEIPGFIERIVTSHDFQQRALKFEEGTVTKRQSVNPEDFVTIDILIAPQREEQRKISEYFDALDHLITLHQRKCDELQNIKKYMLQNMFV